MRNQTSGEVLGDRVVRAGSSKERRSGLLSRSGLEPGEGLWIDPCEGVHSFGMKFPIDVLHIGRNKRIRKVRSVMKPWRISFSLLSRSVLELPAGTAARTGTKAGDLLSFTRVSAILALVTFWFSACAVHHPSVAHAPVTSFDRQIRNAVDAGDGDYQLARLREKVIQAPGDLDFRLQLGAAYQAKGYPELALDHYRLACSQNADSAEAALRLARALVALHHPDLGLAGYAGFLAKHPDAAPLYLAWLGILQDDAGDWKAGERSHRAAAEHARVLGQDRDYLHNNLGYCLLAQGRPAEAQAEFRAALQLDPNSEIARDNLGSALAAGPVGNSGEAIVHLQSVSEPAAAHSNLAALLIERGSYAEARKEVDRALTYDRAFPAALRNLKILSELDGNPAIIPVSQTGPSRLNRMKLAVHRFLVGTPGIVSNPNENTQAASRSTELSQ